MTPGTALSRELIPAAQAAPARDGLFWVLRVNPLRRRRLAEPRLRALLAELAEVEHDLPSSAERCSAELYDLIAATPEGAERRALIALRRAIHNGRELSAAPADPGPEVAAWLSLRDRRRDLRSRAEQAYQSAADHERATLAAILDDRDLRGALALVAPDVFAAAERYRAAAADEATMSARVRKSERGLIQYVARAMVRTSPLSRFTAVGFALLDPEGDRLGEVGFTSAVAFPGLDQVMLGYVVAGLAPPAPEPGLETWVRLPPTTQTDRDGANLLFLRTADAGIRRLSTPMTPAVRMLVDLTVMGPRRVGSVAQDIVSRTGCQSPAAVGMVLGAVRAGILCTAVGPEDGSVELLQPNALDLTDAGRTLVGELAGRLPELTENSVEDRSTALRRIRAVAADLSLAAQRPATVLVEEDYLLAPTRVAIEDWRRQLRDLAAAVELMSAFDRLHDVRALVTAAFVERFGPGANVSLTDHASALVQEVYRRIDALKEGRLAGHGPADGSLEKINALRERVLAELRSELTAAGPNSAEVSIAASDAIGMVADLPERYTRGHLAYGVMVQPWRDRLIFNDAYAGHGMLYGRFLGADRALGGTRLSQLAARLVEQYGADGSRVVEDRGLYRLNVNAHVPVLDDTLQADDWFRLRLAHDRATDMLAVLDADGRKLEVLTLGAGHPELSPPPLRIATWLLSGGRLAEDFVGGWHESLARDERQTRSCPRLLVGGAVLARRRWYTGQDFTDAVCAGPGDVDRLLALTAWRGAHGIPEEVVFKTPLPLEARPQERNAGSDGAREGRREKPQHIDLTSALNSRILPRLLERRGAGFVEEAAPALQDGGHAVEWVVEVGRRSGRRFLVEMGPA